ncbi:hypothetical protein SUGI_0663670 [Cryptomeria japonica]|uniref:UDP-glycosyltransferase 73C13 n=1 Tax=Cryptomeria japonica TaxID=3369 RepID=UPI002414861D|nr:UDP-glycosyltransferase 73C13 [Cryptomeria japonica]GLJ32958.1 hypothetical protein SUGI_0663670 [Cryptomeria japonica]
MESAHIMVAPFHGQGHVFPCVELCKRLAVRGITVTILADPSIAPSLQITAKQAHESLGINIGVLELSQPEEEEEEKDEAAEQQEPDSFFDHLAKPMEAILEALDPPPVCIIGDVMVPWVATVCNKFNIPRVSFVTSGACSMAFEYAMWKHRAELEEAKEPYEVPGFPKSLTLTPSDTRHRAPSGPPPEGGGRGGPGPRGPPPGRGGRGFPPGHRGSGRGRGRGRGRRPPPPPPPGDHGSQRSPPWMNVLEGCHGILINTCRDLESQFVEYVIKGTQKPAWAVGPLLPSSFWEETPGSVTHDSSVRKSRKSNIDEQQCSQWLDAQAPESVIYASFGSEVGPEDVDWTEFALGLEASEKPFILVVQAEPEDEEAEAEDILPKGFEQRVEGRGLVIRGWAPQLLILSHPATGGFLSHCGWNSTVESLGCGVPLLAWPMRGDQHYNAKLVALELEAAALIEVDQDSGAVKRDSIVKGVKILMESEQGLKTREKAKGLKQLLRSSLESSHKELDAFLRHVLHLSNQQGQSE